MKSWLKYIYLFACCTVMLSSCILEEEVLDAADSCETTVELTLSYSDGSPMSRDVSPDDDDNLDYTTVEQKALILEDIYILAFKVEDDDTDQLIGLVEDLSMVGNTIKGRMRPQSPGIDVYFAVLANLAQNNITDAEGEEIEDILDFLNDMIGQPSNVVYQNLIYNTSNGKWLDEYNETTEEWEPRIPMWGRTRVNPLGIASNINEGCDLYRALAKVQIWIGNKSGIKGTKSDGSYDFKITKITVKDANSVGYCVSLNTPDPDINTQYTVPSIPDYASLGNIVYSSFTDEQKSTAFSDMIYLPEQINVGENATPVKILVEYSYNGTNYTGDKAGVIEFTDADGAYNVIRNHSYVFNITGISEPVNPVLQYQVMNWTSVPNPDLYFGNTDGNVNN